MTTQKEGRDLEGQLGCDYCHRQIPHSEAFHPEGEEYAMYFCGLECFQAWRRKAAEEKAGDEPPGH